MELASASMDKTIRLWDTRTGQCLCILKGHEKAVTSIAWQPENGSNRLASTSNDHTTKIWNTVTGKCLHTLDHSSKATSIVWAVVAPSCYALATGLCDGTVRISEDGCCTSSHLLRALPIRLPSDSDDHFGSLRSLREVIDDCKDEDQFLDLSKDKTSGQLLRNFRFRLDDVREFVHQAACGQTTNHKDHGVSTLRELIFRAAKTNASLVTTITTDVRKWRQDPGGQLQDETVEVDDEKAGEGKLVTKHKVYEVTATFGLAAEVGEAEGEGFSEFADLKDAQGRTALLVAIDRPEEQLESVEFLLKHKADPLLVDNKQRTALHIACFWDHVESSKHLIESFADIDAKDGAQRTPLTIAAIQGSVPLVFLLLKKGARTDIVDSRGKLCLSHALMNDPEYIETREFLDKDYNSQNRHVPPPKPDLVDRREKISLALLHGGADLRAAIDDDPKLYMDSLDAHYSKNEVALKVACFDPKEDYKHVKFRDPLIQRAIDVQFKRKVLRRTFSKLCQWTATILCLMLLATMTLGQMSPTPFTVTQGIEEVFNDSEYGLLILLNTPPPNPPPLPALNYLPFMAVVSVIWPQTHGPYLALTIILCSSLPSLSPIPQCPPRNFN